MMTQRVSHLRSRLKTMFGFVFDSAYQNSFNLTGERRIDLSRPRILGEIKNQQRIVLRVSARQQMEKRRPQTINVDAWIGFAAEQLGRRITHGSDRGYAFLFLVNPTGNSKIDQHHAAVITVDHDVSGLQIAIDNRLRPAMEVLQYVGDLNSPFR